ncbi:MAG: imidazolonepropionase [Acidobacteriota bacterium]
MLLVKSISQVITLSNGPIPRVGDSMSDLGIIENGAILIHGDRIVWVGPTKDLPVREPGIRYQTLDGVGLELIALPGLVDSHTHPVFAGARIEEFDFRCQGKNYQEIAAEGGGIIKSVQQFREATFEQLLEKTERNFRQFLNHGTTTIEAKSGYGLTLDDELKSLRILSALNERNRLEVIPTFFGAHAIPEEHINSREEYVRNLIQIMIPRVAQECLAQYCDIFCEEGYFSVEEARSVLTAAKAAGLGMRIHADVLGRNGGAKLAAELGVRSADHLRWINDSDIEALKQSGVLATLLPGTAFNLGLERHAPARELIAAGIPVALATDFNPGTCFTMNMQIILAFACQKMRMSPAETITASTINGAYSLGLSDKIGTLEEGKQADIVLMGVSDYRELPYFFGVNHCIVTIKKGNIVFNRLEQP